MNTMENDKHLGDLYEDTLEVHERENISHLTEDYGMDQKDSLYDEIMYEESRNQPEQESWLTKNTMPEVDYAEEDTHEQFLVG
jgi:hypothetical protein